MSIHNQSARRDLVCAGFAAALIAAFLGAPPPAAAEPQRCAERHETVWFGDLTAIATATGPCAKAAIDLTVKTPGGAVAWGEVFDSDALFGFDEARAPKAMRSALSDWLTANANETTADTLPVWPVGARGPDAAVEFPFLVAEGVSRSLYETARAGKWPTTCLVQGFESSLCLTRKPGTARLIALGVQLFPG